MLLATHVAAQNDEPNHAVFVCAPKRSRSAAAEGSRLQCVVMRHWIASTLHQFKFFTSRRFQSHTVIHP